MRRWQRCIISPKLFLSIRVERRGEVWRKEGINYTLSTFVEEGIINIFDLTIMQGRIRRAANLRRRGVEHWEWRRRCLTLGEEV